MLNTMFTLINQNILPADFDWSIVGAIIAIFAILGICYKSEIELYIKDNFSKKS